MVNCKHLFSSLRKTKREKDAESLRGLVVAMTHVVDASVGSVNEDEWCGKVFSMEEYAITAFSKMCFQSPERV
jgi:hypothetical protein